MLSCDNAEPLLVRGLDGTGLDAATDAELARHLEGCASCRDALDGQRALASALARRPDAAPRGLAERIAARLDAESDWVALANWRAWTLRLMPVAAGLLLAAALSIESPAPDDTIDLYEVAETWAIGTDVEVLPTTALFWQADVSDDSLLEVMLTAQPDDPLDGTDYDQ